VIGAGDTWDVTWDTETANGSDLSATSSWTVTSFSTTTIVLAINIENTTSLTGTGQNLSNAGITAFGFGIDPDATAVLTTSGSTFDNVGANQNQNFPGGFKEIDVCIYSDGCSGGSQGNALAAGESDAVTITLSGTFLTTAELFFFPLKFQTSDGSYEPGGCIDGDCYTAPAPAILGVMGIGLMGMVFSTGLRRRKIS
jgi:hypothetical protein